MGLILITARYLAKTLAEYKYKMAFIFIMIVVENQKHGSKAGL